MGLVRGLLGSVLASGLCVAVAMAIVLPTRRSAARDDGLWDRWAAAHGGHHVADPFVGSRRPRV